MKTPIVLTAFGTTSRALETYSFINDKCTIHFPGHEILWAYSSRMVKDWIKKKRNIDLKHPHQIIAELNGLGYPWAVVQSLHLFCGHEFYRLTEEVRQSSVRTSIGLPVLTGLEDYEVVVEGLGSDFFNLKETAIILIGHGTDHPVWSSYLALEAMFRSKYGDNIFMGVVEGEPSKEKIVKAVKKEGFEKVHLIPFMLVSGVHFEEDLAGDEDSWKKAFESENISVSIKKTSLGFHPCIIDILCKHISEALDVIPVSEKR